MTNKYDHNLDPPDGSLNQIADYLKNGYNFPFAVENTDTITINISALQDHEKEFAVIAVNLWAELIDYKIEITENSNAHITFTNNTNEGNGGITHIRYNQNEQASRSTINVYRLTQTIHLTSF